MRYMIMFTLQIYTVACYMLSNPGVLDDNRLFYTRLAWLPFLGKPNWEMAPYVDSAYMVIKLRFAEYS